MFLFGIIDTEDEQAIPVQVQKEKKKLVTVIEDIKVENSEAKTSTIFNGDLIAKRKKMIIGCGLDHRVVNGRPASRLLREVKRLLEDLDAFLMSIC